MTKNKLKKFIEQLDVDNPPRHLYIGEKIAEYSERKSVDKSKPVKSKDYSRNKYTGKKQKVEKKIDKTKPEKQKVVMVGDKVKSSKYGEGTVVRKTKRAKELGMVTVRFNTIGIKDVFAQSLIIIKKRKVSF